jgi:hypothetical protein
MGFLLVFLPFPLIYFNFHIIHEKIACQSLLFTYVHYSTFDIPHSMLSLVAQSIAEPKFYF